MSSFKYISRQKEWTQLAMNYFSSTEETEWETCKLKNTEDKTSRERERGDRFEFVAEMHQDPTDRNESVLDIAKSKSTEETTREKVLC